MCIRDRVKNHRFTKKHDLINQLDSINTLYQNYEKDFVMLSNAVLTRGYENWGLFGEMNQSKDSLNAFFMNERNVYKFHNLFLALQQIEQKFLIYEDVSQFTNFQLLAEEIQNKLIDNKSISSKKKEKLLSFFEVYFYSCLLYTSPSPRDGLLSRMPSSA